MKSKIISLILALVLCLCSSAIVFADNDASYSIISPQPSATTGITYCDNLLISVKVAENNALRFTLYSYPNYAPSASIAAVPAAALTVKTQVGTSDYFSSEGSISFYTKQINEIAQGLYALKIDTLDSAGNTVSTYSKYFIVKPASEKEAATIYESQPSDKVQFFQNVFKSLFGATVVEVSE